MYYTHYASFSRNSDNPDLTTGRSFQGFSQPQVGLRQQKKYGMRPLVT